MGFYPKCLLLPQRYKLYCVVFFSVSGVKTVVFFNRPSVRSCRYEVWLSLYRLSYYLSISAHDALGIYDEKSNVKNPMQVLYPHLISN